MFSSRPFSIYEDLVTAKAFDSQPIIWDSYPDVRARDVYRLQFPTKPEAVYDTLVDENWYRTMNHFV